MTHPLVTQLRFVRSELQRALDGLSAEDGCRRVEPMNCISWMIGHLAHQENFYWVLWAQEKIIAPNLDALVGYGRPASTPPLDQMWAVWHQITSTADIYLDTLEPGMLQNHFEWQGQRTKESIGTLLQRAIYHYWYHIGEAMAVRQLMGHSNLPDFVGNLGSKAPYQPEEQ